MLLIGISLFLLLSSIDYAIIDAKDSVAASCRGVQGGASVLASIPFYTAESINSMNKKAAEDVIKGAAEVLDIALLSIEAIAIFIVDMYRSLFICLLNLAVHGSLDLILAATEEAQQFITSTFRLVQKDIQIAIGGVESGLASSIKLLNDIPGVHLSPPSINVPALNSLSNVTLPSSVLSSLKSLNSSLPTLSELKNDLNKFISIPINDLRGKINSTLHNSTIEIATLPVPARSSIDLCSNLDTRFVDEIGIDMRRFVEVELIMLGVAAICLMLVGILSERYRYYSHLRGIERARSAWRADSATDHDPLSTSSLRAFINDTHHPLLSLIVSKISSHLKLPIRRRNQLHWFLSYIFHPSALIFLLIGAFGLIIISIEIALLEGPVRSQAQARALRGAANFGSTVAETLNQQMNHTSTKYAMDSNHVILGLQDDINQKLFGWTNTTTTAMNKTLNAFYDGLTSVVNATFFSTPLDRTALDLMDCLIGSKVHGIESAITFIQSHSHLSLPTVSPGALLISPRQISELTSSLNNTSSPLSSSRILDRMLDRYAATLAKQRLGFSICLGVWGLVVVMGIIGLLWKEDEGEEKVVRMDKEKELGVEREKNDFNSSTSTSKPVFHLPRGPIIRPSFGFSSFNLPSPPAPKPTPTPTPKPTSNSATSTTQLSRSLAPKFLARVAVPRPLPSLPVARKLEEEDEPEELENDNELAGLRTGNDSSKYYPSGTSFLYSSSRKSPSRVKMGNLLKGLKKKGGGKRRNTIASARNSIIGQQQGTTLPTIQPSSYHPWFIDPLVG